MADAFRIFDKNYDGKVNFSEFMEGIDFLTCKFTIEETWSIFDFLDKNGDKNLDYNEFCNICEERRREIDPFDMNSKRAIALW